VATYRLRHRFDPPDPLTLRTPGQRANLVRRIFTAVSLGSVVEPSAQVMTAWGLSTMWRSCNRKSQFPIESFAAKFSSLRITVPH
jgi:hypothetical protein